MMAKITSGFWQGRLEVNANRAIFHQWKQLEASGCIENFRIAAGDVNGFREGWFFADSDAYKWLDAASRIHASHPSPGLAFTMDGFISLLARAQSPDGYIFTYNQIHFPDVRWKNLQIEHELYCHGHLIEAGVSHFQSTSRTDMFSIARHAADRIVEDFLGKGTHHTPGHEEIEIALLRLYQVTGYKPYLEMARQFIEQRGRDRLFMLSVVQQNSSVDARRRHIQEQKQRYIASHPEFKPFKLPPGNASQEPKNTTLRWYANALSGKYFQQHAPVRKQTVPVGHSVRFAYLETAITMLARESGDQTLLPALEKAWEHMVTRRMYVTGGIGSLPGLEGFGNDYELDPEYAYAETCAALASMFWNWEMACLTGEAKYSDLFEWQLYNAAAVGMGLDGESYLYNNPLACRGGVTRKPWYAVPCCPSNLSRTWAGLGKYICSSGEDNIYIHQYIEGGFATELAQVEIQSHLPWEGKVHVRVTPTSNAQFNLNLRIPSWCDAEKSVITCNGENISIPPQEQPNQDTASGYDPRGSSWLTISRTWSHGDLVEIDFSTPIRFRYAHPKVKGHHGKTTITRGPLVYCLESVDNPGVDIFISEVEITSLQPVFDLELLGGIVKITGQTKTGQPITLIPYFLWGNRGNSTMIVWINL